MISDIGSSISKTLKNLFNAPLTDQSVELFIKDTCQLLLSSNVAPEIITTLKERLQTKIRIENIPKGADKQKYVNQSVFECLTDMLDSGEKVIDPVKGARNVVLFVGLQGCGKTTTVCKFANYHKKRGFKVGIVCADTFRAGAFDQVKQNAIKIKVPYFGSDEKNPATVAKNGVDRFIKDNFDLILVDTSGRHTQEVQLFEEMKEISHLIKPTKVIFVMDAGIGQSAKDVAEGFKKEIEVGSIILTKLDGTKKAGGALSSVAATKSPIEFIGNGELMEDLEKFDSKRFVSKMLGLGDLQLLAEKLRSVDVDEKEMLKKIKAGQFLLKDFYTQFQQLLKLGPLTKLMELIPGMSGMQMPPEHEFKKLIYIFDSLSEKELNNDGSLFEKEPKRIIRIAIGSGTSPENVATLLLQFKKISQMMKKFGNMPGMSNLMSGENMSMSQKQHLKKQAKNMMPKDMFESMSQFFN